METLLLVVDMQNDFIDGALGTPEARAVLPLVEARVRAHTGPVIFTRDTHDAGYLNTQEGKRLPVPHCVAGTPGWELAPALEALRQARQAPCVDKPTFGSIELAHRLRRAADAGEFGAIELVGICTDICVLSNALLLQAALPEIPISVNAACCAGVTPESHDTALRAMAACQIDIL